MNKKQLRDILDDKIELRTFYKERLKKINTEIAETIQKLGGYDD